MKKVKFLMLLFLILLFACSLDPLQLRDSMNTGNNSKAISTNGIWVDGTGSESNSVPLVYLHQRYANEDISDYNPNITIEDSSGSDEFWIYPEFNKKRIIINFEPDVLMSSPYISISFKFQPDSLGGNNTIISSENFFSISEGPDDYMTSTFYDDGSPFSIVTNYKSKLKNRSGNHFAAVLNHRKHATYFNGERLRRDVDGSMIQGSTATSITIGPYPGKIWDIKIYNRELSNGEVMEEAKWFTDDIYKPDVAPDPDYPNGIAGVYRRTWWPLEEDLEPGEEVIPLECWEYALFARERSYKYYLFQAGMFPEGEEIEYIGLEPEDKSISYDIRDRFIKGVDFDNPKTIDNGNHALHETFHGYQGTLKKYVGFNSLKWFVEATANWSPNLIFPGIYSDLMGAYTFAPHMPLWTTNSDSAKEALEDRVGHEYIGGFQYGASSFLWYLTTYVVEPDIIGEIFTTRDYARCPQYGLFELLGTDPESGEPLMKKAFGDYAARTITWDYELHDRFIKSEEGSLKRLMRANDLTEEEVDNRFPVIYDEKGTRKGRWKDVPDDHIPGSWGYNAYKCESVDGGIYGIRFEASDSNPDNGSYELRVVVFDPETEERTYYSFHNVANGQHLSYIDIETNEGDDLYFIVATTPDIDEDSTGYAEKYDYEYQIFKD